MKTDPNRSKPVRMVRGSEPKLPPLREFGSETKASHQPQRPQPVRILLLTVRQRPEPPRANSRATARTIRC